MKKIVFLITIFYLLFANSNIISAPLLNYLIAQSSEQSLGDQELTDSPQLDSANYPVVSELDSANYPVVSKSDSVLSEVYRIEYGDVLEIVILGEEELSRTLMVMHNGTISFPLVGEVRVIGLTTEEAAELLAVKLTRYYTHPVVSIVLKSPSLPYVSVFGEVLKPGAVEYQRGLRVTDYIALSGGPTPAANLGKVNVVRFLTGEPIIETIDVHEILEKGLVKKNYELKSGEWIYVSKKFTVNWGVVIQTLTFAVTAINLYITVQNLNK